MYVYRCIDAIELNSIRSKEKCIRSVGYGTNTFDYENGQYIHFFLFAESAWFYAERSMNAKAIFQCDIPVEILRQFKGFGFYATIKPHFFVPLPEFAIPMEIYDLEWIQCISDKKEEEWSRKEEYEEYLCSIPSCYMPSFETGRFTAGYNEHSVMELDIEKYLVRKK